MTDTLADKQKQKHADDCMSNVIWLIADARTTLQKAKGLTDNLKHIEQCKTIAEKLVEELNENDAANIQRTQRTAGTREHKVEAGKSLQ